MSQLLCIQNTQSKQSASYIAEADLPTVTTEGKSFVAKQYRADNAVVKLQN